MRRSNWFRCDPLRSRRTVYWVLLLVWAPAVAGLLAGCRSSERVTTGKTEIFVSIAPQKYFVERIGGDNVQVSILVPPGQSMHTYEPTPQQMARLEQADLFFRIGVPFESRLISRIGDIIGLDRIIDTRDSVTMRKIEDHAHEHGDSDPHEGAADPHIWLDPILVKTQARTIYRALTRLHPDMHQQFAANLAQFERDLDSIDAEIRAELEPYAGRSIYVFHPSYGYFTDRYNLTQVAIESEGKEPSARELAELIDRATADTITAIFVQPQFAQKTAEAIAGAVGADLITLDPMAEDYLTNLITIARRIADALGKQASRT